MCGGKKIRLEKLIVFSLDCRHPTCRCPCTYCISVSFWRSIDISCKFLYHNFMSNFRNPAWILSSLLCTLMSTSNVLFYYELWNANRFGTGGENSLPLGSISPLEVFNIKRGFNFLTREMACFFSDKIQLYDKSCDSLIRALKILILSSLLLLSVTFL